MITKETSAQIALLKQAIVVPIIVLGIFMFSVKVVAQVSNPEKIAKDPSASNDIALKAKAGPDGVFTIVDEVATPKDGMKLFYEDYIAKNLKYPQGAREAKIEGRVFLEFIVNEDGRISDVKPVKGIHEQCDLEAVRVLQEAPLWNPGKNNGIPVKSRFNLAIIFRLSPPSETKSPDKIEITNTKPSRHEFVVRGNHANEMSLGDFVIVAVFSSEDNAKQMTAELRKLGFAKSDYGYLTNKKSWYVHLGASDDIEKARTSRDDYQKMDMFKGAWLLTVHE